MAEFLVKIADERGNLAQQVEHGYSESEVRERFAQQGYLVYWVKPRSVLSGGGLRGRKVRQSQFVIFNQQFLTLIKAGLPILNSLDLLIKRQKDKNLQQLLQNVRERVKGGELLSDAFAAQHVFPKIYTTTLLAGEKSGNMEEVLYRVPAPGVDVQEKARCFTGLSGTAGHHGFLDADFSDHLCGAAIRKVVRQSKCPVTGNYSFHAGSRHARAGLCAVFACRAGGCSFRVLEMEGQ